jgi:hypothetical protein
VGSFDHALRISQSCGSVGQQHFAVASINIALINMALTNRACTGKEVSKEVSKETKTGANIRVTGLTYAFH